MGGVVLHIGSCDTKVIQTAYEAGHSNISQCDINGTEELLHAISTRNGKVLLVINCSYPKGALEMAREIAHQIGGQNCAILTLVTVAESLGLQHIPHDSGVRLFEETDPAIAWISS